MNVFLDICNKILKAFILIFIPSIFFGLILVWYIHDNLERYSVYYGKHINHEKDRDPEVEMLISRLESIEKPELKGILYLYDISRNSIKNKDLIFNKSLMEPYFTFNKNGPSYEYYDTFQNLYTFDENYKMESAYNKEFENFSFDSKKENEIKKEIRKVVQPVIDVQPKPKVNLQWIFNWVYENRFK